MLLDLYIKWLQSGTLAFKKTSARTNRGLEQNSEKVGSKADADTTISSEDPEYIELAHLYLLGQKLEDGPFTDAVINAFLRKIRKYARLPIAETKLPGVKCIDFVHNNLVVEDNLRELIVECHATRDIGAGLILEKLKQDPSAVNAHFQAELAERMIDLRGEKGCGLLVANDCIFHSHPEDTLCSAGGARKRGSPAN